ncbi:acyl-CoA dehydrogenase [Kitasatospora azatica]|uniref:acyl-CoA dehydrogenase n=1 Tax=Kitasatospora azatica TaxID=58347 RepID=UPI00068DF625|nr:acyl-CoA dehydrogenase [Kitasatospora azatica]
MDRPGAATTIEESPPVTAEEEIRRRVAELELRFGDPGDPANPVGFAALLAADERSELLPAAVELLDELGFGAEFVPLALGGRLGRADALARILRPVFRRDVALGFGYGITSLFAAAAVWAAGSEEQRRRTAELISGGGRVCIVHHALAHGNAMWQGELTARPSSGGEGFRLDGRKDVVINAEQAGALVVYARTAPERGPRGHSVLLVEPGGATVLPRQASTGMRSCRFAGVEFTDCPVPDEAVVGQQGDGVRLALQTFQLNRSLISAALVGAADTALRTAVRAALAGSDGRPGNRHRALLAGVFADLLLCDGMATTVLRSLHLLPASGHLGAAAVKYLVPDLLREDLEELGTVLGSAGYRGSDGGGDQGSLQKLQRDLPAASLGHLGTAACQAVLIPQLPLLARGSWFTTAPPPPALFRFTEDLRPLELGALEVAGGEDFLAAALVDAAARLRELPGADRADTDLGVLRGLVDAFLDELTDLRELFREAALTDRGVTASPQWIGPADRYVLVAAAGAALGHWMAQDGDSPFLADPAWLVVALFRLAGRLGRRMPELPRDCLERVFAEAVVRHRERRAFDLAGAELAERGEPRGGR